MNAPSTRPLGQSRTNTGRDALILQNQKLVPFALGPLLRRWNLSEDDREDIEAVGFLGLCRAADRYEPGKGAFSTFAVMTIQGYVRCALDLRVGDAKARKAGVSVASLDAPLSTDTNPAAALVDTLADPDTAQRPETALLAGAGASEITAQIHAWINAHLTEKQARLVWLYYGDGLTLRQIAEKQGRSHQMVDYYVKQATAKLRDAATTTEAGKRLAAELLCG